MNMKITYFVLVLTLLFITIKELTAARIPQNSQRDVNPLLKRGDDKKKCYDYVVATAEFDDDNGVTGLVTLSQDDQCDKTFVDGLFSRGFDNPDKNCYGLILEDCDGNVAYNLTEELCFDGHGGTKPFQDYIHFDLFEFLYGKGGKRKRQAGPTLAVTNGAQPITSTTVTPKAPAS
ncbi:1905_t:CDS:1 [Dentiscutata erythropus]|uniref:1905_t:CDS:1 n=1 Tax=Dentiscutata erythropus TaxID=1348616 RepID=A0A9N9A6T9_9GLOM|nr:1905_t:CDS:1 [Dentiscutata erythropus]